MRRMKYRAPKAGALPGCATPRQELLNHSKALATLLQRGTVWLQAAVHE